MFDKKKIDLLYRLICLIVFSIVVLFVESPITLGLLFLFFFLTTRNNSDFTFVILYIITFITFCFSYMNGNYFVFKLGIIIDYVFYFLNVSYLKELLDGKIDYALDKYVLKKETENNDVEDDVNELDYIRFKSNKKEKKSDTLTTIYLTVHFMILFLSILVG